MRFLRIHFFSLLATLLAVVILLCIFFGDFNFIDTGIQGLLRIENNELDEFLVALVLVIGGLIFDQVRARNLARRRAEIDEHRLEVLQATMRAVQDVVNNFLNNMQLFRMEAEDGPLSPESLQLLDDLIFETADKLKALGDSKSVVEYQMAAGAGILPAGATSHAVSLT